MDNNKHFCTCNDLSCKLNPHNHSKGCDLCIKKNLKLREIPSCFFKLINEDLFGLKEFTIESFVDFYLKIRKTVDVSSQSRQCPFLSFVWRKTCGALYKIIDS